MQMRTLFSFLMGLAVFTIAALTSAKNPLVFLDWHAALIVFGGTFAAAAVSFGFDRLFNLTKVLARRMIVGGSTYKPRLIIEQVMTIGEVYRNHPERLREEIQHIQDPFLKESLELIADNYLTPEDLIRILSTRTASIYHRYHEEALKFRALAKFPPAFGLMGAVLGMVGIMSELGGATNNSMVGPGMALALVGTLYGVSLANLVILPLAENLQDSAREVKAKNMLITQAIHLLLQKKNPILMAEDLNSFLLANERVSWRNSQKRTSKAA